VTYDDSGAVDVQVSFASDSAQPPEVRFELACTDQPVLSGTIVRFHNYKGDTPGYWQDQGTIQLAGYQGDVTSAIGAGEASHTLHATFSHPEFANRKYRCARGQWDDASLGSSLPDDFHMWFSDFGPQKLTTASARQAADTELRARYGSRWTRSRPHYVHCAEFTPAQDPFSEPDYTLSADEREQIADNPAGAKGLCMFQFGNGRAITAGELTLAADDEARSIKTKQYSYRYKRAWHGCHPGPNSAARVRANKPCGGPSILAGDIEAMASGRYPRRLPKHFKAYAHGTNTAGFDALFVYRCRSRTRSANPRGSGDISMHVSATCSNAVGERFTVGFYI